MKRFLLPAAISLAGILSACSNSTGPTPAGDQFQPMVLGGGPHFLSLIADAPFKTAYYVKRHVFQRFETASGSQVLEYTEKVWSDGNGRFTVLPEQLISPQLPPQAQQVFLLMQKAREGFLYRLRDFRIQQLARFLEGYSIEALDDHPTVAGQACERLRIRAQHPAPTYWELDVLPTNGLILVTHELAADGSTVGKVEALEYQASPDLTGVHLYDSLPVETLDLAHPELQLGFALLQPHFLPGGFALAKAEKVTLGQEIWARLSYTDGGETLFFLHRQDPTTPAPSPADELAGKTPIKVFQAGRWTAAQTSFDLHHLIVVGRQPYSVLQQMLESSVP